MSKDDFASLVDRAREILASHSTFSFKETTTFASAVIRLVSQRDQLDDRLRIVQARCTELLEEKRALQQQILDVLETSSP